MLIRRIHPEDNPYVAAIIRDVMTEHGAVGAGYSIEDPEIDDMHAAYSSEGSVFYVLEEKQGLVGCGGLARLKGGTPEVCELQKMYFLEQARGLGLGRLLGETLLMDARRFGYRRVYIETLERMQAACRLYEKLGFTRHRHCLGATGHSGCDAFFVKDIEPLELDPQLLA